MTTLVATAAVAPFAIYHFHRLSHYGVVANLIALPLVGLLIMPFALLGLIAMPFGLEPGRCRSWDSASTFCVATGKWVASWPGAVSVLPSIPPHALLLLVAWRACGSACGRRAGARSAS